MNNKATKYAKVSELEKEWFLVDATDLVIGRMATQIAHRLRGKHKPNYTPNLDSGDNIIVINADKAVFTGNKTADKQYFRHTGHPGGIKETSPARLHLEGRPDHIIKKAVQRMLPREEKLGKQQFKKLYVYNGAEHPHEAQQPKILDIAAMDPKKNKKNK